MDVGVGMDLLMAVEDNSRLAKRQRSAAPAPRFGGGGGGSSTQTFRGGMDVLNRFMR